VGPKAGSPRELKEGRGPLEASRIGKFLRAHTGEEQMARRVAARRARHRKPEIQEVPARLEPGEEGRRQPFVAVDRQMVPGNRLIDDQHDIHLRTCALNRGYGLARNRGGNRVTPKKCRRRSLKAPERHRRERQPKEQAILRQVSQRIEAQASHGDQRKEPARRHTPHPQQRGENQAGPPGSRVEEQGHRILTLSAAHGESDENVLLGGKPPVRAEVTLIECDGAPDDEQSQKSSTAAEGQRAKQQGGHLRQRGEGESQSRDPEPPPIEGDEQVVDINAPAGGVAKSQGLPGGQADGHRDGQQCGFPQGATANRHGSTPPLLTWPAPLR